jgi:hypothetical protein
LFASPLAKFAIDPIHELVCCIAPFTIEKKRIIWLQAEAEDGPRNFNVMRKYFPPILNSVALVLGNEK